MKKTYQKPELFAESFELAEHITSGCAVTSSYSINSNSPWTCMLTSGSSIFMINGACSAADQRIDPDLFEGEEDAAAQIDSLVAEILGGICYTTMNNAGVMVNS